MVHIVLGLCPRVCHRWYSRNISFASSECYRNTCIKLLKYFSNNTTRICYVKHLICFLDVNCLLHLVFTSSFFLSIDSRSKGIKTEWLFTILMQKLKKNPVSPVACPTLIHLPIYFFFINDQIYKNFELSGYILMFIGKTGVGSAVYLSCLLTVLS